MKSNTKKFLTILSAALLVSLLPIQATAATADTEPKIAKEIHYEKQYNGTWKEVFYYQYTYDKNGNLIKSYFRESNETDYAKENRYRYDSSGNLLSDAWYRSKNGSFKPLLLVAKTTYDYEYDTDGKLLREYRKNGNAIYETAYQYDANGNLISKTTSDAAGQITDQHTWVYDGNTLTAETETDSPFQRTKQYDADGNLICSIHTSDDFYSRDIYEYENGKLIKRTSFDEDGKRSMVYKIHYNGNMKKEVYYERIDGKLEKSTVTKTTQNAHGDVTKIKYYDYNPVIIGFDTRPDVSIDAWKCKYDENGNVIQKIQTEAFDGVLSKMVIEYL